jgi:segregation and condensation protein A
MTFTTKLEVFEGPLDLLLHLIKINEVEISDIPIATITDQYLEYLDLMRALDINIAGDFLVMASTLMHIKSKMLVPKQDELEDIEDPREEIARSLSEYMQLKEAANELSSRNILERDVFKRGMEKIADKEDVTTAKVSLYDLMDAFKKIVRKKHPQTVLRFHAESWSVKKKMVDVIRMVKQKNKLHLGELFSATGSVPEMIATFLAILELVKTGLVNVFQRKGSSDIMLEAI